MGSWGEHFGGLGACVALFSMQALMCMNLTNAFGIVQTPIASGLRASQAWLQFLILLGALLSSGLAYLRRHLTEPSFHSLTFGDSKIIHSPTMNDMYAIGLVAYMWIRIGDVTRCHRYISHRQL